MFLNMWGICFLLYHTLNHLMKNIKNSTNRRNERCKLCEVTNFRGWAEVSKCCDISWANWRPVQSGAGGAGRWYITMPIRLNYPGPWCCSSSLLITSNLPRCWHQHHTPQQQQPHSRNISPLKTCPKWYSWSVEQWLQALGTFYSPCNDNILCTLQIFNLLKYLSQILWKIYIFIII